MAKILYNSKNKSQVKLKGNYKVNKLAFGQTRFAAAADRIEHISEEKGQSHEANAII